MFKQEVSNKQSNNASSQVILISVAIKWRLHCGLSHKYIQKYFYSKPKSQLRKGESPISAIIICRRMTYQVADIT